MNLILQLFLTFAKIGAFTFGGGYAMLPLIDHECVENKKWITNDELLNITVVAESTPGPIAINCATYVGYKKAGIKGALAATFGVVLPSFIIIFILSSFMENLLAVPIIAKIFKGIRAAVAFLIMNAGYKMIKKMLKNADRRTKTISIILAVVFFGVVLGLDLANIGFSSIYLILISGFAGFFLFGLTRKKEDKE